MSPTSELRPPNAHHDGVIYQQGDYVGIFRRLVILFVDSVLIVFYWIAIFVALFVFSFPNEPPAILAFLPWMVFAYLYLTGLKARLGTLGYLVAGARIVTLRGERPSLLRMTFRLMLRLMGPFPYFIDLLWIAIDPDYQTLVDRYSGTLVVRRKAAPISKGSVGISIYFALGFALRFPTVCESTDRHPAPNR